MQCNAMYAQQCLNACLHFLDRGLIITGVLTVEWIVVEYTFHVHVSVLNTCIGQSKQNSSIVHAERKDRVHNHNRKAVVLSS